MSDAQIQTAIKSIPHWRLVLRPTDYRGDRLRLESLGTLVQNRSVSLRGWPFPHQSPKPGQRGRGNDWISSWSEFKGHLEYWRFYESGQFAYIGAIREFADKNWHTTLETRAHDELDLTTEEWQGVRGFVSVKNVLYTVTEYFEFAARLAEGNVYDSTVSIQLSLNGVEGFVLMTEDWMATMHSAYRCSVDQLSNSWTVSAKDLLSQSAPLALDAAQWLFVRFGWDQFPKDAFGKVQESFLMGKF